jgi:hypothetical protein
MKERRQVLYGLDVIAELHVDTRHHRTQVEHELRSKLLRLRQKGAQVLSQPDALLLLCLESVSTFVVLGRHALLAAGKHASGGRHSVVRALGEAAEVDISPLETLLSLREDKAGTTLEDPGELFAQYLTCVEGLVKFVDGLKV